MSNFEAPPSSPDPRPSVCLRRGCPDPATTECAYVDRDRVACATWWCEDHVDEIVGQPYCIRHSGMMRALTGTVVAGHRPPVGNRAASLVAWVANDLEQRVARALENVAVRSIQEHVVPGTIECDVIPGVDIDRYIWRRGWRLTGDGGTPLTVSIEADEARDYEVGVRVAGQIVTVTVPPWVKHHIELEDVAADKDRTERFEFYNNLGRQLADAINAARPATDG